MNDTHRTTAVAAVRAMARHGVELPGEYHLAEAVHNAARDLTRTSAPAFAMPTDPKKAAAAVTGHAKALADHAALQLAAAEASQSAQRAMLAAVEAALPGWYSLLAGKFAEAVETFCGIPVSSIDGMEDEATILAYGRKVKAATELDLLWTERLALGQAVSEPMAAGGNVWVLVESPDVPGPDSDPGARRPFIDHVLAYRALERHWTEAVAPKPAAERWELLVSMGARLRLAGRNEAQRRALDFRDLCRWYPQPPAMSALGQSQYDAEQLRGLLTPPGAEAA